MTLNEFLQYRRERWEKLNNKYFDVFEKDLIDFYEKEYEKLNASKRSLAFMFFNFVDEYIDDFVYFHTKALKDAYSKIVKEDRKIKVYINSMWYYLRNEEILDRWEWYVLKQLAWDYLKSVLKPKEYEILINAINQYAQDSFNTEEKIDETVIEIAIDIAHGYPISLKEILDDILESDNISIPSNDLKKLFNKLIKLAKANAN